MSNRDDGRGHWPAGKRRHEVSLGRGRNVEQWLQRLGEYCTEHRLTSDLAAHLGVTRPVLYRYFRAERLPDQERLEQMDQWWGSQDG
jgi:hypothetical protein